MQHRRTVAADCARATCERWGRVTVEVIPDLLHRLRRLVQVYDTKGGIPPICFLSMARVGCPSKTNEMPGMPSGGGQRL